MYRMRNAENILFCETWKKLNKQKTNNVTVMHKILLSPHNFMAISEFKKP